jgi:hypothetical protein
MAISQDRMQSVIKIALLYKKTSQVLNKAIWELLCDSLKPGFDAASEIQKLHTLSQLHLNAIDPELIENLILEQRHYEQNAHKNLKRRQSRGLDISPQSPASLLKPQTQEAASLSKVELAPISVNNAEMEAWVEMMQKAKDSLFYSNILPPGLSPEDEAIARNGMRLYLKAAKERVELGTATPADRIAIDFWEQELNPYKPESDAIF